MPICVLSKSEYCKNYKGKPVERQGHKAWSLKLYSHDCPVALIVVD